MKLLFTLLFCMAGLMSNGFAQNSSHVTLIKTLPDAGVLLDQGWLYHVGDNPSFAKSEYHDSNWQPVNPNQDIHELPFLKNGVVWFRLRLSLDSNVRNQQLALSIHQSGATEMYLNGRLIQRYGLISEDHKKIKAYSPLGKPIIFLVSSDYEQLLAIRYAVQPGITYTTLFGLQNPGLHVRLSPLERASEQYENLQRKNLSSGFFAIGVYFLFTILHLAFFLFYPSQKSNLYFSIYAFGWALTWLSGTIVPSINHIALWSPMINTQYTITFCSNIMFLTAVYQLFQVKIDWKYYGLLIYGIATVPWTILVYDEWEIPVLTFQLLFMLRIVQISVGAVRNQKKGAWIVAAGAIVCFICWFVFGLYSLFDLVNSQSNLFFMVAQMTPPLAFSIYLSYQFALTYKSLQQNLSEVKRLSAEKQQILTTQNEILEKQVAQRTIELQNSLSELKSTQSQLIQSEKMASLGELTAGIAHEIQNPLNFVNNFSEVNKEMLEEMSNEMEKGNLNEAKQIAKNVIVNQEKINQHGKRADAIVKGMLQHSKASSGQKELTDLNALADEFLSIAYHGIRAKYKSFNVTLKTQFDPSIGKVKLVPQEIGRVLLNLYNNAFYAVSEKKKRIADGYEPLVSVSTERLNGKLKLTVMDNGDGIPERIREKIFQPFFTTKPAGEGTGLGLSLAYDIVTKGHDGQLEAHGSSTGGAVFTVQLPH